MDTAPRDAHQTQQAIARRMADIGFVLPGSVVERMMRCGKRGCRCRADPPRLHGPYNQWTRTVEGKTVTKLLSAEQRERYQPWFDNARALRNLTRHLETVSVDAITRAEGWGAKANRQARKASSKNSGSRIRNS
jgi:hypothetical protein